MAVAKGIATLHGEGGISGIIRFQQRAEEAATLISGQIKGLTPGKHGLRILIFGDTSDSFKALGSVFNPLSAAGWGLREDDERPVGALGNIEAGADGVATFSFTDRHIRLIGPLSVLARAVGVTAGEDDGGKGSAPTSNLDGAAGPIVAAGVIGIAATGITS